MRLGCNRRSLRILVDGHFYKKSFQIIEVTGLHLDLRLKLLKALLNVPMRVLDRFLPERKPTFPQTVIVDRMFKRMYQAYRLEVAQGVFKEIDNFEGDGNFLRMLRVSQKLLTAIGEDDR